MRVCQNTRENTYREGDTIDTTTHLKISTRFETVESNYRIFRIIESIIISNHLTTYRNTETSPVDSAGCCSSLSFSWFSKFMYNAKRKGFNMKELPAVSPYDSCNYNVERYVVLHIINLMHFNHSIIIPHT